MPFLPEDNHDAVGELNIKLRLARAIEEHKAERQAATETLSRLGFDLWNAPAFTLWKYSGYTSNRPCGEFRGTHREFARWVGRSCAKNKESLPLFCAAEMGGPGNRNTANVVGFWAVVIDHDKGMISPREAARRLRAAGVLAFVYASPSDSPQQRRFRVVFYLSRKMPKSEHRRLTALADTLLGGGIAAAESYNVVCLWHLGRVDGTPERETYRVGGIPIDLFAATSADVAPVGPTDSDGDLADDELDKDLSAHGNEERVRSAMLAIPNPVQDWNAWIAWGLIIFNAAEGETWGLDVWKEWSAKHLSYDEAETEGQWAKFDRSKPDRGGMGTIVREAKLQGWRDEWGPHWLPRHTPVADNGDVSNGERFAREYGDRFRYVKEWRAWLVFDGTRLIRNLSQVEQAAKAVLRLLLDEATDALRQHPTDATRRAWQRAHAAYGSAQKLAAMLEVARSEPGISIRAEELDNDPWLLGVRNGVVNLRTGRLVAAHIGQLITKQAGAAFHPDARCPRFERFLAEVSDGIPDLPAFLLRATGYSLTGSTREEVWFFLWGEGRNGKSVLANILVGVFGDYAVTSGPELLARRRSDSEAARLKHQLPGARLVLVNEVGVNDTWDDLRVKELVSRERIATRALYGEAYHFVPTHAIWARGNHRPGVLDAGNGMWRRTILVPFTRTFPEGGSEDLDQEILDAERDGILGLIVRGCLEWQRDGLRIPEALRQATQAYRDDTDAVGTWFRDCCEAKPGERTRIDHLYGSYRQHCSEAGLAPMARLVFSRRIKMAPLSLKDVRSNGQTFILNVALRSRGPEWDE